MISIYKFFSRIYSCALPYCAWIFGLIFLHLAPLRKFARKSIHSKIYTNKVRQIVTSFLPIRYLLFPSNINLITSSTLQVSFLVVLVLWVQPVSDDACTSRNAYHYKLCLCGTVGLIYVSVSVGFLACAFVSSLWLSVVC